MTQTTASFPPPPPLEKPFVFISYKSEERAFVERLAVDLEARGVRVWWDRKRDSGIQVGTRWQDEIDRALKHVESFIIVVTPLSVRSEMVRAELASAYARIPDQIIPIMVQPVPIPDLPFEIRTRQFMSFVTPGEYALRLGELVEAIDRRLNSERAPIIPPPALTVSPSPACQVRYMGVSITADARPSRVEFFKDRLEKLHTLGVQINPATDGGIPRRLVALTGRSGFGKTTALRKIISALFECRAPGEWGTLMPVEIIHHRIDGAITIDLLKDEIADMLADDAAASLRSRWAGATESQQIALLVAAFAGRRVILTFDSFDAMLNAQNQVSDAAVRGFMEAFALSDTESRLIFAASVRPLFDSSVNRFYTEMRLDEGLPDDKGGELIRESLIDVPPDTPDALLRALSSQLWGIPKIIHEACTLANIDGQGGGELAALEAICAAPLHRREIEALFEAIYLRLTPIEQHAMIVLAVLQTVSGGGVDRALFNEMGAGLTLPVEDAVRALRAARRLKTIEPQVLALEEFDRVYLYERVLNTSLAPFDKVSLHARAAALLTAQADALSDDEPVQVRRGLTLRTQAIAHHIRAGERDQAWALLDGMFDALDRIGHYATLITLHEQIGTLDDPGDEALRLRSVAMILHYYGRQREAIAYARQAAERANAIADPPLRERAAFAALNTVGVSLSELGDFREARLAYTVALGRVEKWRAALEANGAVEVADRFPRAHILNNLIDLDCKLGRLTDAQRRSVELIADLESIEAAAQAADDEDSVLDAQTMRSRAHSNLCRALIGMGELNAAIDQADKAIALARAVEDSGALSHAYLYAALAQCFAGHPGTASMVVEKALELDEPANTHNLIVLSGLLQLMQGQPDAARAAFSQYEAFTAENFDVLYAKALCCIGLAIGADSDAEVHQRRAEALLEAARARADGQGVRDEMARLLDRLLALPIAEPRRDWLHTIRAQWVLQ